MYFDVGLYAAKPRDSTNFKQGGGQQQLKQHPQDAAVRLCM
jgi:hypothetical protein